MKFEPGERFDRYVIEGALGEGGMARVYRARDSLLDRKVALKIVNTRDEGRASLFPTTDVASWILHEARAAAALDHSNVVSIHDVGEVDGAAYIAMELIQGKNLRTFIGDAAIPMHERIRWLADVARALAAAHKLGLVHRDVKPENVMVRDDGVVKVLDFGIARRPQAAPIDMTAPRNQTERRGDGKAQLTLAGKGVLLGTPRYMAPEQMAGEPVDGRADQFAWGVVAYELLSGKSPWKSDDDLLLIAEILSRDPPPLSDIAPDVPARVASTVTRALAKSPGDRFDSAQGIVSALEPYAQTARRPRSSPLPAPSEAEAKPAVIPSQGAALRAGRRSLGKGLVLGAFGAVGIVTVVLLTRSSGEPRALTPPPVTSAPTASPVNGCTSNATCAREGEPAAICRRADGACVALESPDCKVLASKEDIANDETIWIGAMFPTTGADATNFGVESMNALELARRELASIAHGIPQAQGSGVRPIALVACDDNADAMRAAHHLVDDLKVPAVVGFHASQEVIDLATELFIPNGVLAIAALNRSSLIATIPHAPGQPRLVWRTTINSAESAEPVSKVVAEIVEPELRAAPLVLAAGEPIRVAFLHPRTTAGLSAADALFSQLSFNGKRALENGDNYRDFPHPDPSNLDALRADASLLPAIVKFQPHVIVYVSFHGDVKNLILPIEARWPAKAAFRPRYVANGNLLDDDLFAFIGKSPSLRRRFLGVNPRTETVVNAKMTTRYNDTFSPKVSVTSGPGSVYDAFYVLAYAAYAAGDGPIIGASLARGISRLVPPGTPIDVGPTMIFDAFNTLRGGHNIDLNGTATGLDFDLATGDSPTDFAVLCVKADATGNAAAVIESNVVFDARSKTLDGLPLRCP